LVSADILIISTTSLSVELIAFGLLFFGYSKKRKRKYRQHGVIMTTAVALHLVVILSWMISSFVAFFSATPLNLGNILQVAALVHVTLGTLAVLGGVWLVGSWRLKADVQKCFGRKQLMLITITIWSSAILLGILLYTVLILS
jgi:uncharacterized membrane protein YozB (DUF420 family)